MRYNNATHAFEILFKAEAKNESIRYIDPKTIILKSKELNKIYWNKIYNIVDISEKRITTTKTESVKDFEVCKSLIA